MPRLKPCQPYHSSPINSTEGTRLFFGEDETGRVICQVVLFNHLTYQVVLSRGNGVWYPLKDGRYFDLDTLLVRALTEVIGV
jgi:hypothetical protein